ncbi:hypothetical protein ACWA1F_05055 [Flavobacterium sp. 3-218]
METQINLKTKNTPQLWVFLSGNIFFLCSMFFPAHFEKLVKEFDMMFVIKTLGMFIAPLILFLLNGLLSSHQKAVLVFWKMSNPLPGSEAFSKISRADTRIDREKLKTAHGSLPKKAADQNKLWYKIYKKNSADLIVSESHRAFLLARDLTSLSFLFLIFIGLPILWSEKWPLSFIYFLILIAQYLLVRVGARNRGRRFVANVLAIESNN